MTGPQPVTDRDTYIELVIGYGRTWMLRALHQLGLKQGVRRFSDRELAAILWRETRVNR